MKNEMKMKMFQINKMLVKENTKLNWNNTVFLQILYITALLVITAFLNTMAG